MEISATEATLAPGTVVAGYDIAERIGVGRFGEVYRARSVLDRDVALRVLPRRYSHDAGAIARFVAEVRAVSTTSHPGIVEVFDFGTLGDGRQFCAMELVSGTTLRDVLRDRERLPIDDALPMLRGIAEPIDAAHRAGIAHCDLKPDNIFVLADGGVRVSDFGLAKLVDPTDAAVSPVYMSPEQCRGSGSDTRSDTYSFGVIAYQLLTGELPFSGDALALALHHLNDDPDPPSKRQPDLPMCVDRAVLAALAKDPVERPSTLIAIVDALAAAATLIPQAWLGRSMLG
jgi:serine/threonine protein kinase